MGKNASRVLPTICDHMCNVEYVWRQSASGRVGHGAESRGMLSSGLTQSAIVRVLRQATARFEHTFAAGRISLKSCSGPDRPLREFSAAVGTAPLEYCRYTDRAEGAFEAANPGFCGFGRQIAITALAIRLQDQHMQPPEEPLQIVEAVYYTGSAADGAPVSDPRHRCDEADEKSGQMDFVPRSGSCHSVAWNEAYNLSV